MEWSFCRSESEFIATPGCSVSVGDYVWLPRRMENASCGNRDSDSTVRLAFRLSAFLPTPMLFIPARRAASTPAAASSTTMQERGSAPARDAAIRKTCGSGFPAVTSSAPPLPKPLPEPQRIQHRIDIRSRRRRSNRLTPAIVMQTLYPCRRAGKRRETLESHQLAVAGFLRVADPLNIFTPCVRTEPSRNDRVISLAEAGETILSGDVGALAVERFLPGPPVVLFGVHQSSIKIPHDCTTQDCHLQYYPSPMADAASTPRPARAFWLVTTMISSEENTHDPPRTSQASVIAPVTSRMRPTRNGLTYPARGGVLPRTISREISE